MTKEREYFERIQLIGWVVYVVSEVLSSAWEVSGVFLLGDSIIEWTIEVGLVAPILLILVGILLWSSKSDRPSRKKHYDGAFLRVVLLLMAGIVASILGDNIPEAWYFTPNVFWTLIANLNGLIQFICFILLLAPSPEWYGWYQPSDSPGDYTWHDLAKLAANGNFPVRVATPVNNPWLRGLGWNFTVGVMGNLKLVEDGKNHWLFKHPGFDGGTFQPSKYADSSTYNRYLITEK
ncbi:MAG: hypothetical protein ACOZAO_02545 [Patescibacteria group bacterium]